MSPPHSGAPLSCWALPFQPKLFLNLFMLPCRQVPLLLASLQSCLILCSSSLLFHTNFEALFFRDAEGLLYFFKRSYLFILYSGSAHCAGPVLVPIYPCGSCLQCLVSIWFSFFFFAAFVSLSSLRVLMSCVFFWDYCDLCGI